MLSNHLLQQPAHPLWHFAANSYLVRETMLWLAVYAMLTRKAPARQSLRHGQTVWALGASQPIGMPKPYGRY